MRTILYTVACLLYSCGNVVASPYPISRRVKGSFNASLPIVDLGYAVHQATINASSSPYYNFSNIRFGEAPLGDLRFSAPLPVNSTNRTINDGQTSVICPQANPAWEEIAFLFLAGVPLPVIANETSTTGNTTSLPTPDPRTSEDCLFLDVFVPEPIFNSRNVSGAAVMVWIYGGGYTAGDKSDSGNPAGLLAQSQKNDQEGVIYVAMNYRLGLFGWQSGPTFQESGTANAGLYDQRLALEWVQKHIHLFGGDPNRVTVFGESAGGGSIMHQVTAFGSTDKAPFQQALLQSPGFIPIPGNLQQETTFQSILSTATALFGKNITSVDALRALSTVELQTLNTIVVGESPYGTFTFNPTVDGSFVPALPGVLLSHGQFDNSLNIMLGHNSDEGLLFTNPFITTNADFASFLEEMLPDSSNTTRGFILDTLYPPIFDESLGYTTEVARVALAVSELSFTCNTRYFDLAFNNETFSYFFAVPPGIHGEDVAYTYFNGDTSDLDELVLPAVIGDIALGFQSYLTSFAMNGNPNTVGLPEFPVYGEDATVLVVNTTGFTTMKDTVANLRCDYWQKALFF